MFVISIIIPTYNEVENIENLIKNISNSMGRKYNYEIIVVDDNSPDGTYNSAKSLSKKYPVKAILREGDRGLSKSVLRGFYEAKGGVIGVMDADLSHPPEVLPKLIDPILKGKADITVGSRLAGGGCSKEWPLIRKVISVGARSIAIPLTPVKDSISGYFFVNRKVITNVGIIPRGYKILLEILVKGKYKKAIEVPIIFRNRFKGKTKLGTRVYIDYMVHILSLYCHKLFHD